MLNAIIAASESHIKSLFDDVQRNHKSSIQHRKGIDQTAIFLHSNCTKCAMNICDNNLFGNGLLYVTFNQDQGKNFAENQI